jgi:hypothetical protein
MNRSTTLVNLVITTIFFAVTGVVGLLIAPIAFMGFDAPGSERNPLVWIAVLTVVSYPFLCFLAIAGGWILFALHKDRGATLCSLVPMVNIGVILTFVIAAEMFP